MLALGARIQMRATMPVSDDPAIAAVCDFLSDYLDDLERGEVRPLAEYLRRFAGHEEPVAAEYLRQRAIHGAEAEVVEDAADPMDGGHPGVEGERRVGPYRLVRELGRGGQGAVWLAEDTRIERRVALKLLPGLLVSEERRARLRREAESVARMAHPGICAIHEAEVTGETPYIAMQYVPGETVAVGLADAVEAGDGPRLHPLVPWLPTDRTELARVLHFFERTARALHAAHETGLLHRDIKPANVMVTPAGEPVLLDFGLARDEQVSGDSLSRSGDIFGTPSYTSPEQLRGAHAGLDRRTDVFSLGVTLYEALTGERPFQGESRYALEQSVLFEPLPDPRALNPALTEDVRVVLETATDKDRERRYPTALDLAEDLRRIREFEPVSARPAGPWLRLTRWARRQPALAAALGATILALSIGLAVALVLLDKTDKALADKLVALRRMHGRQFAARAVELVDENPAVALAVGIWAVERLPDHQGRSALFAPLEACHLERVLDVVDAPRFFDLVLSRDGALAAGATSFRPGPGVPLDGRLVVWEVATGEPVLERRFPGDPVRSVGLHPTGKVVLAGTEGGRVLGLEVASGDELFDLSPGLVEDEGQRAVRWLEFAPDGASFAVQLGASGALRVRFPGARVVTRYSTLEGTGQARVSPDGARLLTSSVGERRPAGESSVAEVWDLARGERLAQLDHPAAVRWAEWSPDGERVVTACADGGVRLWSADGQPLGEPLEHGDEVLCATFDPEGLRVATASGDGSACVWNLATRERLPLVGHAARVVHAAWSPDGARVATTSRDNSVRIWRAADGRCEKTCRAQMILLASIWTADGRRIVTHSRGFRTFVWNVGNMPHTYRLGHETPVRWAVFTPDGTRAVTAGDDGTLRVWATPCGELDAAWWQSGAELALLAGHQGPLRLARISPDGRRLLSVSGDATARLWELSGGELAVAFPIDAQGRDAGFLPDGRAAFVQSPEALYLLDFEQPTEVTRVAGTFGRAALAPDGSRLATVGEVGEVALRDPRTGAVLERWTYDGREGVDLAWRPDGLELAVVTRRPEKAMAERLFTFDAAGRPGIVDQAFEQRLTWAPRGRSLLGWDETGGRAKLHILDAGRERVVQPEVLQRGGLTSVAFDSQGEWVATASMDGTVHVWSTDDGTLLVQYPLHGTPVNHVAFAPQPGDLRLISAADDGTAAVWPADPLPAARERQPRELDELEARREWFLATGERR